MRISGGLARGIPLQVPKQVEIRPATEANRERLFSSLGGFIKNASFLDLFSGTGSYGLEALSRGAKDGVFVENNRKALACLKKNLENVSRSAGVSSKVATVHGREVNEYLRNEEMCFDLIFLDPPYPLFSKAGETFFSLIRENKILKDKGMLIHETPPETKKDFDGWSLLKIIGKNKKGSPSFRFFQLL